MIRFNKYAGLLFLFLTIYSCNVNKNNNKSQNFASWQTGKIYDSVKIFNDTTQSYAIYLPESYDPGEATQVLIFFDPHAKGSLPVKKYHEIAEKYDVLLACSNNSKNGMPAARSNDVITKFIGDLEKKFNVDKNRLITGGFSGGARIAALIGIFNTNVKGIIECGGGFPGVQKFKNNGFSWVGISGNEDFNYLEMKNLYGQLKASHIKAYFLNFEGKHEWPPAEVMEEAFGILLANKTGNLHFTTKDASKITSWDRKEIKQQNLLAKSFTEKDLTWWRKRIKALNEKSKNAPSQEERLMNARLISYLGIMSYMFTSKATKTHNIRQLEKYVQIYRSVDSLNPDMFYYGAVLAALKNNKKKSLEMLNKAMENGFDDMEKLQKEKAFKNFKTDPEFRNIISMKPHKK